VPLSCGRTEGALHRSPQDDLPRRWVPPFAGTRRSYEQWVLGQEASHQFCSHGSTHATNLLVSSGEPRPTVVRVADVHISGHSWEEVHVEMRSGVAMDLVVHLH